MFNGTRHGTRIYFTRPSVLVTKTLNSRRQQRFASETSHKSLPFTLTQENALDQFQKYHRSPLTGTPKIVTIEQKYVAFYLFNASAKTQYRASIGRAMSMPYRDPQTGKIHQRQRIVWTTLPQIHEIESEYRAGDAQSQVYAGLEQYEELMKAFVPMHTEALRDHSRSNISEEKFQMTTSFAESKLRERVIEHASQIAREMLMQEYGANVKINDIAVQLQVKSTMRAYYPLWIFNSTSGPAGRTLKYLVSAVTGKVTGLKLYDPTLSGLAAGSSVAGLLYVLLGSPFFSFLILVISYLAVSTVAKWLPIWRTMRWEGRRAADSLANKQHGGDDRQDFAGFGNFNPFDAFMGGAGSRRTGSQSSGNPFNDFDPFAGAGSFNGQRRSSDPFYGYGRPGGGYSSSAGSSQQSSSRNQQTPPQKAAQDLYATLGVKKGATKDEITDAFRKLAMSRHPDKVPAEEKAAASKEFARINEAYRVLRNPGKRDQYDRYGVI